MQYEYRSVCREVGTDEWEHLKGYRGNGVYSTPIPAKANITSHKKTAKGWHNPRVYEYKIQKRPIADWEDYERS